MPPAYAAHVDPISGARLALLSFNNALAPGAELAVYAIDASPETLRLQNDVPMSAVDVRIAAPTRVRQDTSGTLLPPHNGNEPVMSSCPVLAPAHVRIREDWILSTGKSAITLWEMRMTDDNPAVRVFGPVEYTCAWRWFPVYLQIVCSCSLHPS